MGKVTLSKTLTFLLLLVLHLSCSKDEKEEWSACYHLGTDRINDMNIPLLYWDIYGPVSHEVDSIGGQDFVANPIGCGKQVQLDTTLVAGHRGIFTPLFGQVDLKEVFGIAAEDTTQILKGKVTYLSCNVIAEKDSKVFLQIKTDMPIKLWLNGDTLVRKEIQGLNFYPLVIQQGDNTIVAKVETNGDNLSFEANMCDEQTMIRLFAEGQSGNIIYPLINSDINVIMLTNGHQNVADIPVSLMFHDVQGMMVAKIKLQKDSITYHIPTLQKGMSYMCSMQIGNNVVRQPVLCGKDDDAYVKFSEMRKLLPDTHPRAAEIDQLLYRLNFLLHHPSRYEGDWWWQFKITPVTYQLERLFAHLEDSAKVPAGAPNIQFVSYQSALDGGTQRYILATPNNIPKDKAMPLVVVIRPSVVNHHHFFCSPQIARQWAVNIMQALANRYGFLIMMPEARLYHDEELTPMAEAEIKLAINDVRKHYLIDEDRIYLHANCSGAYRALQLASLHPDWFAAIGLYAPLYHQTITELWSKEHAPEHLISNITGIPVMIHGDPTDKHSPYILYQDLISDCRKHNIPLTLSVKRNSEKFYNVVLVGEEACEFFRGKQRNNPTKKMLIKPETEIVIADMYAQPFVYVYHAGNKTSEYRILVDSIRHEYEHFFFTDIPLVPDTKLTEKDIMQKNLFLIGDNFDNPEIKAIVEKLQLHPVSAHSIELSAHVSPLNPHQIINLYRSASTKTLRHIIHTPWKDCLKQKVVISLDSNVEK